MAHINFNTRICITDRLQNFSFSLHALSSTNTVGNRCWHQCHLFNMSVKLLNTFYCNMVLYSRVTVINLTRFSGQIGNKSKNCLKLVMKRDYYGKSSFYAIIQTYSFTHRFGNSVLLLQT